MEKTPPLPRSSALRAGLLALLLGPSAPALAGEAPPPAPLALPDDAPEALRPWARWVLHGHERERCPFLQAAASGGDKGGGGEAVLRCAWPSRLDLALDEHGGRFVQEWRVHAPGWVRLPGDLRRWPQEVQVDGRAAVVVAPEAAEGGAAGAGPAVWLARGDHRIAGRFLWDELPEALDVPPETGLLALTLRGQAVRQPVREASGRVFLQRASAAEEADVLEVQVHRLVDDDVPLGLTTRLELRVSGKSREVVLPALLPAGFTATALESPVPARLEPDGRLRTQVRAGTYSIQLSAHHEGRLTELRRPDAPGGGAAPWGDEVWAFQARPSLRVVDVEGVTSIDPQQTRLPEAWKRLPAYPVRPGEVMRLVERRRGDSDPAPDELSLQRDLWLDFDGRGYTVTDRIEGTLHRADRLDAGPPLQLGRVAVGGKDQLITRSDGRSGGPPDGRAGVEIRQGQVSLSADSRIEGRGGRLPAVGWDADFRQVGATLHLPPGWRLLWASGADEVPGTWVASWSLLDLFLALIVALAIGRLYGEGWGLLALVALGLLLPEAGAPRWVLPPLLAVEALVRLLREGRLHRVLVLARLATRVALVLVAVGFVAGHVRAALHPQLEHDGDEPIALRSFDLRAPAAADAPPSDEGAAGGPAGLDKQANEEATVDSGERLARLRGEAGKMARMKASSAMAAQSAQQVDKSYALQLRYAQEIDQNASVQTGPGLPRWSWTAVPIRFSGPVERGQQLRLRLLSPTVNRLLALLRVVLLALIVLRLLDRSPWRWRARPPGGGLRRR